ncbi:hypothetical protein OBBRIDRAFT_823598 [Obba rivulosa]|uniref:non-specific serine/threonine protein kinase n=1 Tax=Obba rivulosa TaxID=1052685 RepID=A0A8E2DRG0_9APHY|nr:hypothetical protein OBBRIDRAFT_823598 [Obba rivulosa]
MDIPSSTPFPLPTFQTTDGGAASPADLYGFLLKLLAGLDPQEEKHPSRKQSWVQLISSLAENFLSSFPFPHDMPWHAMHEKIKLVEVSLDLISKATELVPTLFLTPDDFLKILLSRLMILCTTLEAWVETSVASDVGYPNADALQLKAVTTIEKMLGAFGTHFKEPGGEGESPPAGGALSTVIVEFIGVGEDILVLSEGMEFPLHIRVFGRPRVGSKVLPTTEIEKEALVTVHDPSRSPGVLTLFFEICCRAAIRSSAAVRWHLSDLIIRTVHLYRHISNHLLSPACATTPLRRARALKRLWTVALTTLRLFPGFQSDLVLTLNSVISYRLELGPSSGWDDFDLFVKGIIDTTAVEAFSASTMGCDIQDFLEILCTEEWGASGEGLRALGTSYLIAMVPHMTNASIKLVKDKVTARGETIAFAPLLDAISQHSPTVEAPSDTTEAYDKNDSRLPWQAVARDKVESIIEPDELTWMDDHGTLSNAQYITRALQQIETRFHRPLYNPNPEARSALAESFSGLLCILAHPGSTDCKPCSLPPGAPVIPAYTAIVNNVLDNSSQVTAPVRKTMFKALTRVLRHTSSFGGGILDRMAEQVSWGMKDPDRNVRLSAGHSLVELVRVHQTLGGAAWRRTQQLFTIIYRIFELTDNRIRETTLVTVGRVAMVAQGEVLGQSIGCLISQLGHSSPIVRGLVSTQLRTTANAQKKKPYNLVTPFMDQIAPFVVTRLNAQPTLLLEFCRFLSVSPLDFVSITLNQTLPQVFARCDSRILQAISHETEEKPSSLFLKHAPEILAYAFRLQAPGQTHKVLTFIVGVLQEAAGDGNIDVATVVGSCIVPLLAELVVALGNDNPEEVETAMQALIKVERMVSSKSNQRATPPQDTGAFLRSYMLGVITHINDMLQDVQGKRPVEAKKRIIKSLGPFMTQVGPGVSHVSPQIMATLQTMLPNEGLADATLQSWLTFLTTLESRDIGPHVGPTSASFVAFWPTFSLTGREICKRCLEHIICDKGEELGSYLDEIVDLGSIPQLADANKRLAVLRRTWGARDKLQKILDRSFSESTTVAIQSLLELKSFIFDEDEAFIRSLATGDVFDPLVGRMMHALFSAACRDGDGNETLRLLAFECIGSLGALDPDRFDLGTTESRMVVLNNFTDENESMIFALHLIKDVLVGAFRSTSDIKYQSHLAYAIQELLHFCKFTPALVTPGPTNSVSIKVRNRWNSLPKYVLESVTPLLESRFRLEVRGPAQVQLPVYPSKRTYREWVQSWTSYLITRVSGERACNVFNVFQSVVRNKDVGVAHHLLPHLVLTVLLSGQEDDTQDIRSELLSVLEDQVRPDTDSTDDKKVLSAQTVFMLFDHLNNWARAVHQEFNKKKSGSKRSHTNHPTEAEEQLLRVDSVLSSIDQGLMAQAALQCKAYARSLMNFEQQVVMLRENNIGSNQLQGHYERLHEIYAHLDEPDGMEGISTLILSPSLEHQIREHESTGRWTSAQSCWEVRLQQSPDNLDFHLGLLRCLRNLGHYDTLRTHVKGVLTRNPEWEAQLVGYQVESESMVGNWGEVDALVKRTNSQTSAILLAKALLALRTGDVSAISESLSAARKLLGAPIAASGVKGYRRSYDSVLDLHLLHELEIIDKTTSFCTGLGDSPEKRAVYERLSRRLDARLESTLPAFRTREPILSMRRTAFALSCTRDNNFKLAIGQSWLASAKIARKAGYWQTAYSAILQGGQCKAPFSFMESARLIKASGEPLRALQDLDNSVKLTGIMEEQNDVIDLTGETVDSVSRAKAQLLRARWMNESDRFEAPAVLKAFQDASQVWPRWENGHYHLGKFQDECFRALSVKDKMGRGTRMNLQTVRYFSKAIKYGTKYIYQTVPRLLTIWLDMGENPTIASGEIFPRVNGEIARAIKSVPVYKWYTAFPQIVSRVGHTNSEVYELLSQLISMVIQEYPRQALWLFVSVVKSMKAQRSQRGKLILDKLRAHNKNDVPTLIGYSLRMTEELLGLCDHPIRDEKKTLTMSKNFPGLFRLAPSPLMIPLQESLTASLPPSSSSDATHHPFPTDAPTFCRFTDEIEIMRSLAKPRKITILGSDGQVYMFLGKPRDDLRKDARLMEFNGIINKLLKSNSESRRRQLRIRTYGVVTLNEECGFIQWVPNTIPVRPILLNGYDRRKIKSWTPEMTTVFGKIKDATDKDAARIFVDQILPQFPPIFHEWFTETFPEPTAWLASRLSYTRTAAVMSIIGFILGLGDRHCENILLDVNTGDVVHVDFNCLFEKGKTLETPERVPFRLTQNVVDGFGVAGVEGVFRIACEVTLKLLRDNKDVLMSVLDAFVHDPLVEWEDEKRKLDREAQRRNTVRSSVDLRELAKHALQPIEKKLKGIYTTSRERPEKETSTSNLVQMLIQEATSSANLAKMYPGWAPWH